MTHPPRLSAARWYAYIRSRAAESSTVAFAALRAPDSAGSIIPISTPMIEMETSSSISVKARPRDEAGAEHHEVCLSAMANLIPSLTRRRGAGES